MPGCCRTADGIGTFSSACTAVRATRLAGMLAHLTGTVTDRVDRTEIVAALAAAPSVHNSQPWRIRMIDNGVELHADLGRWLHATDRSARELRISCGAGLLNMRLATAAQGRRPVVTLLPDPGKPALLALLRPGEEAEPSREEAALHAAIPARRSNRRPFRREPVVAAHRHLLRRAAEAEGAWLLAMDGPADRARLAELLARAHRIQSANPGFRTEWRLWTGLADGPALGVPAACGGAPPEHNDAWMVRDFTGGRVEGPTTGHDPEPLVVMIGTHHDLPVAQLRAGEALQRVLLTATAVGLSTSVIAGPVEVEQTRRALGAVLGPGLHPQILVRVGHGGPAPPRAPRLPVARVRVTRPRT